MASSTTDPSRVQWAATNHRRAANAPDIDRIRQCPWQSNTLPSASVRSPETREAVNSPRRGHVAGIALCGRSYRRRKSNPPYRVMISLNPASTRHRRISLSESPGSDRRLRQTDQRPWLGVSGWRYRAPRSYPRNKLICPMQGLFSAILWLSSSILSLSSAMFPHRLKRAQTSR